MPNTLLHAQLEPITPIFIKYIIKCIQLVQLIKHFLIFHDQPFLFEPYLISSYLPLIFYLACIQVGIGPLHSFEAVLIISDKIKWNQFWFFWLLFLLFILLITFTISSTSSHLNHQRKGRIFTPLHQNNLHPSSDTYKDKHLHE